MRITFRYKTNKDYWQQRWSQIKTDEAMENTDAYPLKFSQILIKNKNGKILEAGCGAGRILKFYHYKGFNITGIDFIEDAIEKINASDTSIQALTDDITNLSFPSDYFEYVLAFGLYHNLNKNLQKAIQETFRVLKKNGSVCASFRADNIQTRLVDWLHQKKINTVDKNKDKYFHKMNLKKNEFINLFETNGFEVKDLWPVENMPLLYKFKIFRSKSHKMFDENLARKQGYKLSALGNLLQWILMKFFPNQFCNIYVLIAEKK